LNLLNEIKPINWQGIAMAMDETKQMVFGKWKIYGNVHFKKNITGSEFLNEIDVSTISTGLAEEYPQIDTIIEKAHVRKIFSGDFFKIYNIFFQNSRPVFLSNLS